MSTNPSEAVGAGRGCSATLRRAGTRRAPGAPPFVPGCGERGRTGRRHVRGGSAVLLLFACALAANGQRVVEARAATLAVPFDQLARQLPQFRFDAESGGSRFLLRKLLDLNARMDLLALADAGLFTAARGPRAPRWWVEFAGNELVIAYTARSRFAAQINATNWMDILLRPEVSFGYADPALDPEGYNTLRAWRLAERYYHRPGLAARLRAAVPAANRRPQSVALLALLEAGQLDYAWEYLSVARQHGLRYVRLPPPVNMAQAIVYGITIPATARNVTGALAFLQLLVSPRGAAELAAAQQPPRAPCLAGDPPAAPQELARWLGTLPRCPAAGL
ncbi:MAG TPA: extracellular solute-binding protein [Terriglobales bacterium]|nr:extracellular solute-binding protein [Terriglobales bacterium]